MSIKLDPSDKVGGDVVKRRAFLRAGAAVALTGPAVATPAIAQSAPEIQWRMSSSYPKSTDAIFGTAKILCRYVAEATDNKFQIQAYAAGELTPSRQALDAATSGSVDCAFTPLHFYYYKDPVLGVGSGLPFGLNARHQLSWWAFGGGNEIVNAALKKLNVYGIPAGSTGAQMGAWFKKEINTLEDLKGLRIRVGALGAPIFERVGAKAHYLSHADVYSALETGTIDAAEFICPHDDERLGIAKLAKYNYHPCWWESGGMVHLVVNLERWDALPRSYRAIVERACNSANSWMLARYDALNPPALKRLVAAGALLKSFPQPVLEACHKAATDHFGEVAAKDAPFKKGLDSVNAFRREQLPWWQIAEYAYDSISLGIRS
jgi:TRAP-type mannitol/chloroaromatic compound transport system substrate-binding protein